MNTFRNKFQNDDPEVQRGSGGHLILPPRNFITHQIDKHMQRRVLKSILVWKNIADEKLFKKKREGPEMLGESNLFLIGACVKMSPLAVVTLYQFNYQRGKRSKIDDQQKIL